MWLLMCSTHQFVVPFYLNLSEQDQQQYTAASPHTNLSGSFELRILLMGLTAAVLCSFGVVLWELSSGEQPEGRALRQLVAGEEAPAAVVELMHICRAEDPALRPSAVEIVHILNDVK